MSLTGPIVGQPNSTEEPKIPSAFTAIQTWANGNIDGANFASGAVEPAFSTYKSLGVDRRARVFPTLPAGTYALNRVLTAAIDVPANAEAADQTFYLTGADFTAGSRSTKYRLRAEAFCNAVAPAMTLTVGLYPVATWAGASGSHPTVATLGAVVNGSTVAFASPAANSQNVAVSTDFAAPAAGWYLLCVVLSGTEPANGYVNLTGALQMRQA